MKLHALSDHDLLHQTQQLVQRERELLSEILQHLKEVERRKLYSDLGYSSLFDYCLRALKYSEAQAGRRIQALKLVRELPQVEEKIVSGALNLTLICQAQSFFSHMQKTSGKSPLAKEEKLKVLSEMAHKSSRQAQALLVQKTAQAGLAPQLPPEKERVLSEEHSEFRLVINQELRQQLEQVKGLLGPKALGMTLAELIGAMAEVSLQALKDKKFGKRRTAPSEKTAELGQARAVSFKGKVEPSLEPKVDPPTARAKGNPKKLTINPILEEENPTAPAKLCVKIEGRSKPQSGAKVQLESQSQLRSPSQLGAPSQPTGEFPGGLLPRKKKPRSISKREKWQIWQRDGGRCSQCGAQKNLQVDHQVPVARGGTAELENLRLLCGNCNLRQGIKSFGPGRMRRSV